jgi:hypothetical protein
MSWRGYVLAFLLSNLVLAVLTQAVFMTQAWLPLNPDHIPNMRWDTALHTMVSFLTNTNQQHYPARRSCPTLADDRHHRPAGGHADDGAGTGSGDAARPVLASRQATAAAMPHRAWRWATTTPTWCACACASCCRCAWCGRCC